MCGLFLCEYIGSVCLVTKYATFKNLLYLPSLLFRLRLHLFLNLFCLLKVYSIILNLYLKEASYLYLCNRAEFIDELIRFENIFKLIRKEKIAKEFESKVSTQTIKELEKDLEALINWAERSERALMESAIDFYNSCVRSTQFKSATGFSYNRSRLIDTVRLELEERKKQIDPRVLGEKMVDSARGAIASVLGLQVGSLALGAAVVSAFSSVIVDITGILTTIAVIATAFSLLPRKRRNAIKEFSKKIDGLIEELISSVRFQLERDLDGIKLGVLDSLIPLKNFYKTEQKKIIASKERVNRIYGEILALKESVL